MFPANASLAPADFSWNDRQTLTLPLFVAKTLREWAVVSSRMGERHHLRLGILRSIIAIVDAYVWQPQASTASPRFVRESIRAVVDTARSAHPYPCGHSQRVARLSAGIAKHMGWRGRDLNEVYVAGMLHDVGKVGIDARILHKPGKLTEDEYGQIKTHSEVGYEMLVGIEPLERVLPAVLHHHEHWNGGGYPHGLRGETIPAVARIVAVADAHDAMISDRPYRSGMPIRQVRRVFAKGTGVLWDPDVVSAYLLSIGNGSGTHAAALEWPRPFPSGSSSQCAS
jgi:HD-GYP domain-containing protein (c-di-GMP phosphodiesterase class II)